jgi:hypothetical protein
MEVDMRSFLRSSVALAVVATFVGVPATSAGADLSRPVVEVSAQYICWESMPAVRPAMATSSSQKCDVRIGLSTPTQREVTFTYRTEPGSAKPQVDYVEVREGKGIISPGATGAYVTLQIVPDRVPEPDEFFTVLLLQVSGADIGRRAGTVIVRDSVQSGG